jgi:hypothetical protein
MPHGSVLPDACVGVLVKWMATGPEQRAWLISDETRWRRAHRVVERHPGTDVDGVYHVLRNLEKTPTERLRAALLHGLLFGLYQR